MQIQLSITKSGVPCSLTASMVPPLLACIPRLRLGVFRREVDKLDEGASNVYSYMSHKVGLLMGKHNAGGVPPPLVCSKALRLIKQL